MAVDVPVWTSFMIVIKTTAGAPESPLISLGAVAGSIPYSGAGYSHLAVVIVVCSAGMGGSSLISYIGVFREAPEVGSESCREMGPYMANGTISGVRVNRLEIELFD